MRSSLIKAVVFVFIAWVWGPANAQRSANPIFNPLDFSLADLDTLMALAPHGADTGELARFAKRAQRQSEQTRLFQTTMPEMDPSNFGGLYNILHQNVSVDIDPETGDMTSEITFTFTVNNPDVEKLPFLFPDTLEILTLQIDGEESDFIRTVGTVILSSNPPFSMDVEHSVYFQASGTPKCTGGFSSGCHFGSTLNYITHGEYFPQNPSVSLDRFGAILEITVPEPIVVAGTGRLVESFPASNPEKTTYVYTHDFETSYLSFSMGPYLTPSTDAASIPITTYIREKNEESADSILELATNIVGFFEDIYSVYPFLNLDVVEIHNSFSGGYGPQATIMMLSDVFESSSQSYFSDYRVQLMSHEIAHQWWGNMISIGNANSITLSEGLAEFSSSLHWEKEANSLGSFISDSMTYMYTVPAEEDVGLGSTLLYASPQYQTIAYDKGCSVFNMLRYELGESTFLNGMKIYIEDNGYSTAVLDDFFDAMEEASGEDLGWFFEQWFVQTGYPRFSMATKAFQGSDNGEWYLQVTVDQDAEIPFSMHLPIRVIYDINHRTEMLEPLWIDSPSTTRVYRIEGPIKRVSPDPNRAFLQRTRSTLEGDVNLSGALDGSDLVDMAVLYRRDIVVTHQGGSYFWPNGSYLPRFDLNTDGKIDESDVELLLNAY